MINQIVGALFGSKKLIESIPDGIDKRWETQEEKSDDDKERIALWIRIQETIANENSAFSLVRRSLAIASGAYYLGALVMSGAVFVVAKVIQFYGIYSVLEAPREVAVITEAAYTRLSGPIMETSTMLYTRAGSFDMYFGLVMGLYFGPGVIRAIQGKK